jgi:ankyrin repeat protein
MVQYLIEHGAAVDYQGGFLMETPLHWAIRKNFYRGTSHHSLFASLVLTSLPACLGSAVAKLLIDSGASLRVKSNVGVDVLHLACQLGESPPSLPFWTD